jgi:apolipoprotein N-acyltransferase
LAEQPGKGSVDLTPRRALVVAAVFGALAGWLVVVAANALDLLPPRVPWSAPIGLAVFAALVAALARSTRQRLQVRREWIEPRRAVAFLVLGKACALAGAAVAGGYLGFAIMFVTRIDADTPRDRVIRSAVVVLAAVALALAGLRLERACKVPDDEDDPDRDRERDPR